MRFAEAVRLLNLSPAHEHSSVLYPGGVPLALHDRRALHDREDPATTSDASVHTLALRSGASLPNLLRNQRSKFFRPLSRKVACIRKIRFVEFIYTDIDIGITVLRRVAF